MEVFYIYMIYIYIFYKIIYNKLNAVNPRPFLDDVTGRWIAVKLKWGWELRGILKSSDAYMNLHVFFFIYLVLLF